MCHEAQRGNRGVAMRLPNLGARCWWLVSAREVTLVSTVKEAGWTQNRSERIGKEKNILPVLGSNPGH